MCPGCVGRAQAHSASAGTQRKRRQGEAGTFAGATTGRPARVRCGTQARQAVWLAMCVRITAMVQGNHGMVAQARRHLDPCVSVERSANTSGTYENGATSRREYREARVLARIARALARYGRRVRWASLPAEQRGGRRFFCSSRRRAAIMKTLCRYISVTV